MADSSRRKAQSWPYPRHAEFENELRVANQQWFKEHSYPVHERMPYLLEKWDDWHKNIILPQVAQYIRDEEKRRNELRERFPLHKYIHHGLSSQAMLFNLVGPLVVQGDLTPFQQALAAKGIPWPAGEIVPNFEVEDRQIFNEDTGQPTSIDLVIRGERNTRSLFIEAKLVEREFGGCSVFQGGDCDGRNPTHDLGHCYLHHIGRRYWELLEKHGFLSGPVGVSPICPLTLYYQFFRELLFAIESGGDFVLLYDHRNPSFFTPESAGKRGLMPFLRTFVPEGLQNRVHAISIQEVLASCKESGNFAWLEEFEKKYALS